MAKITFQDCELKLDGRRLEFIVKDINNEDFRLMRNWFRFSYGKHNPKFSHADGNFNVVVTCCPEHIATDLNNIMKSEKFVEILTQ